MAYAFTQLLGTHLRKGDARTGECERVQTSIALANKSVVALLFPGPPARNLRAIEQLTAAYDFGSKRMEIVCVPPPSLQNGLLECERRALKLELAERFGVDSFPNVVLLDADARLIEQSGMDWSGGKGGMTLLTALGDKISSCVQKEQELSDSMSADSERQVDSPQKRRCLGATSDTERSCMTSGGLESAQRYSGDVSAGAGLTLSRSFGIGFARKQPRVVCAGSVPRSQQQVLQPFVDHSRRTMALPPMALPREWKKFQRKIKQYQSNGVTIEWFGSGVSSERVKGSATFDVTEFSVQKKDVDHNEIALESGT